MLLNDRAVSWYYTNREVDHHLGISKITKNTRDF